MKQLLSILFLSLASSLSAQEQVTYCSYNFDDNVMPEGCSTYDVDGQTLHYTAIQMGFDQGDSWKVLREEKVYPYNYYVASTSRHKVISGQEILPANDWLVLPSVLVRDANAKLTWRSNSICDNLQQTSTYNIRVSTTGNKPEDFTDVAVLTVDGDSLNHWTEHEVDLGKYVGKQVWIAFQNVTLNGDSLAVDDIVLSGSRGAYEFSTNADPYVCGRKEFLPTLTFTQLSSTPVKEFTAHMQDMDTGDEAECTLGGLNLQPDESIPVTLYPAAMPVNYGDTLRLRFWVTVDSVDSDPIQTTTVFLSFNPEQHVVIEEGTGTWCGWCPKGIVALRQIEEKYGEKVLPICVHVDDNLEVEGYVSDEGVRFPLGFPSGLINREYDSEPMKELHEGRKSVFTIMEGGFGTWMEDALQKKPLAELTASAKLQNGKLVLTSTTVCCIPQKDADLRLAYILSEDTWSDPKEVQSNYISGADYEMGGFESMDQYLPGFEFDNVARGAAENAFGGIEGSLPSDIEVDTPIDHDTQMTVPASVGDIHNCSVTVLLIDHQTGIIQNAVRTHIIDPDGIDSPAVSHDNKIYDLSGRRVRKPVRGMYISAGHKYIK